MRKLFSFPLSFLFFVLVIGSLIGWTLWRRSAGFQVNVSRAAVIKEMRELNRLETASFTIEKILDAHTNGNMLQQVLFGDKILLIAHGEVIAGFDLSQMKDDDIQVEGKKITVHLPAPQILVSRLDNDQTRVYDRQQGLLAQGQKDLETEVRQQAEQSIRAAACEADILAQAKENGRKQLTSLLNALGFTMVEVTIPETQCR